MVASSGLLVAVGAVEFEAALLAALEGSSLHVVRRCVVVADLLSAAASHQAQGAVVSAHLGNLDRDVVARLRDANVVVVGATAESSSADEAALRRLGIDALVSTDDVVTLDEALADAMDRPTATGSRPSARRRPARAGIRRSRKPASPPARTRSG